MALFLLDHAMPRMRVRTSVLEDVKAILRRVSVCFLSLDLSDNGHMTQDLAVWLCFCYTISGYLFIGVREVPFIYPN